MEPDSQKPNESIASSSSLLHEFCGENDMQRIQPLPPPERSMDRDMGGAPTENSVSRLPSDSATSPCKGTSRGDMLDPCVVEGAACAKPAYIFQIHAARAIDPLIGEVFVCPQTLEALCLQRMLGLPLFFTWECLPSPSLSWRGRPASTYPWWPLANTAPTLPAAVDPKTGMCMSGSSLLEALRSCVHSQVRVPELHGPVCSADAAAKTCEGQVGAETGLEEDKGFLKSRLCFGTCELRSCFTVEQATEVAATELVQQAVETALRFYMWRDEETFRNFTSPMLQNTFGCVYGSYYGWAVRRSITGATAACTSPRVFPEDLRRHFPDFEDSGATHDAVTVEELLAIDGLRRALRVVEQLLQGKQFLGGSTTNALDATVFAHLAIIFSLPLPDRRDLQRVLLNSSSLLEYCRRVQEIYQIWPVGPSFLFGVSSLCELASGTSLRVHSWRQQRGNSYHGGYEEETECNSEGQARRFLWWLGSAAFCALLLMAAGKTPFCLTKKQLPRGPVIGHGTNNG